MHRRAAHSLPGHINPPGHVFLLGEDGKVSGDQDLIFFSNPESETGCVKVPVSGETPLVLLELGRAPAWTKKITVCYSICSV